jgi:hypothetical protein
VPINAAIIIATKVRIRLSHENKGSKRSGGTIEIASVLAKREAQEYGPILINAWNAEQPCSKP